MLKEMKDCKGFTLIDLSIAMVILGLLAIPLIQQNRVLFEQEKLMENENRFESIRAAIAQFAESNGRLPCPARPNRVLGDASFGMETYNAGPPASCDIYEGAVPFQSIRISENLTMDTYGNKITYAVSNNLIDIFETPTRMTGNLSVIYNDINIDAAGNPTITPVTTTTNIYVLISHGESGNGAYAATSDNIADRIPCDTTVLEGENCDGDTTFLASSYSITDVRPDSTAGFEPGGLRSLNNNVSYYDDIFYVESSFSESLFNADISSMDDVYSNYRSIGIGTDDPDAELHINGNAQIDNGDVKTTNICTKDGSTCFRPEQLGTTGMVCASGTMVSIEYSAAKCKQVIGSGLPVSNRYCPNGQVVSGFSGGRPVCVNR